MFQILKPSGTGGEPERLDHFEPGTWVQVITPIALELDEIARRCEVSREMLEDSADPHELPRVEQDNGGLYIYSRMPLDRDDDVTTRTLTMIYTPDYLITISFQPTPTIDPQILQRLDKFPPPVAPLLIAVAHEITKSFYQHIKAISKKLSSQRVQLRQLRGRDMINLVTSEEALHDFNTALVANVSVYERVLAGKVMPLSKDDHDEVQDLIVDGNQVVKFCQASIETITNIREAYTAILSNNINKTLKFLTSMAIILTVPLLIASIYGMNVTLPFGQEPAAFLYIMGFTVIATLATFAVFVWRKWL